MKKILLVLLVGFGILAWNPPNKKIVLIDQLLEETVMLDVSYKSTSTINSSMSVEINRPVMGSGVFVSSSGHILTCAHLFRYPGTPTILITKTGGGMLAATLISSDTKKDLAIVLVNDKPSRFVQPAAEYSESIGEELLVCGFPYGLGPVVSDGILSALSVQVEEDRFVTTTNAAINPGNSGGPAINSHGELVGISDCLFPYPFFVGLGGLVELHDIREFLRQNNLLK